MENSDNLEGTMIRMALPKGRMQEGVIQLLRDAGIGVKFGAREYRPIVDMPNCDVKLLKPQNILEMLHVGSRDIGFAGHDWVLNLGVDVVEVLDLGLDPVRLVAASPNENILIEAERSGRKLLIASEYEKVTKNWIEKQGLNATFVRTYGATESYPPEDADLILDNTATGSTLKANGLKIVAEVLKSSTRLYCSRAAYNDPNKRQEIEQFILLLKSVLLARKMAVVEFNVREEILESVLSNDLPCMRAPTVSKLFHDAGYSVAIALPRTQVSTVLPMLKRQGATDIILLPAEQIIP
jgi:ATP phosphoribosyltransferase